jgi:hypothetical protein
MIGLRANNLAFTTSRPPPARKMVFQIKPVPPFRLDLTVWALCRLLAGWHPYGGLIYFHLLLNRLAEEGHLS